MRTLFLAALSALMIGQLQAQTGTIDDPLPSDRSIEAQGGQARNEKYWYLLPSYEQIKKGIAHFTFHFATYPAPDSFDVYYGNRLIYTTDGFVTDTRTVNLSVSLHKKQPKLVRVVVNDKGNPGADTQWVYSIESRVIELKDANDDSTVNEAGTAFITGDNPPLMPKLFAQVRNPDPGSKIRWKLKVKYGTKTILIPASGKFTKRLPADQPYNFYEHYVNAKGNDLGFFGGDATLTFQVDSRRIDTLDFRIGGKNPDPATARAYIDSLAPSSAIAYPVGKAETLGYCGANSTYNQFYDANSTLNTALRQQQIGFPIRTTTRGYGMYQLAKFSKPTTTQIWNWQTNIAEGIRRLTTASTTTKPTALDGANTLITKLFQTYPDAEPLPDVSYPGVENTNTITGVDATVLTAYDTFKGCPTVKLKTGNVLKNTLSCWTYDPAQPVGSRWTFNLNQNNFVRKVVGQIE